EALSTLLCPRLCFYRVGYTHADGNWFGSKKSNAYSSRLEAGSRANCRLETGGGSSPSCPTESTRLVNTRYHSDERARPCIHLPQFITLLCPSHIQSSYRNSS
ncbi:hypothetical protein BDR06DRAFT_1022187, partial [Suillus hirtellus]